MYTSLFAITLFLTLITGIIVTFGWNSLLVFGLVALVYSTDSLNR